MVRAKGLKDGMDRFRCRDCEDEENNTKQRREQQEKRARMQNASERMKGRRKESEMKA